MLSHSSSQKYWFCFPPLLLILPLPNTTKECICHRKSSLFSLVKGIISEYSRLSPSPTKEIHWPEPQPLAKRSSLILIRFESSPSDVLTVMHLNAVCTLLAQVVLLLLLVKIAFHNLAFAGALKSIASGNMYLLPKGEAQISVWG